MEGYYLKKLIKTNINQKYIEFSDYMHTKSKTQKLQIAFDKEVDYNKEAKE